MAGTESGADADEGGVPRIVRTEDVLGGDPRIAGRRVGVLHVYQLYVEGDETPEAIASDFELTVAEVHAALAYAFNNPEEIRTMEERNRRICEEARSNRLVPPDTE